MPGPIRVWTCPACAHVRQPRVDVDQGPTCGVCNRPLVEAAGPSVELLLGFYDQKSILRATLACLQAQSHARFRVSVLDESATRAARDLVRELLDPRFVHVPCPGWQRDWHYTVRQAAALTSPADWLGFPPSDALYAPTYLEQMLAAAQTTGAELVGADWVYAHAGYQPWTFQPVTGHVDLGGFLVRADVFRLIGGFPDRSHEADGHVVEALAKRGRVTRLAQTLYLQN